METSLDIIAVFQEKEDSGSDVVVIVVTEKKSDSGHNLKAEPIDSLTEWIWGEQERSQDSGLSSKK